MPNDNGFKILAELMKKRPQKIKLIKNSEIIKKQPLDNQINK